MARKQSFFRRHSFAFVVACALWIVLWGIDGMPFRIDVDLFTQGEWILFVASVLLALNALWLLAEKIATWIQRPRNVRPDYFDTSEPFD